MAEGVQGLIDFVGYPTGQGIPSPFGVPFAGLIGLVDFAGYPIGLGLGGAVGRGAFRGAGKHLLRALIHQEQIRSAIDHRRLEASQQSLLRMASRVERQWNDYQEQMATMRGHSILSVVLSEV